MKETTTFIIDPTLKVEVTGSELVVHVCPDRVTMTAQHVPTALSVFGLTRSQARDLSKALSHAADIVRSKRKREDKPSFPLYGIDKPAPQACSDYYPGNPLGDCVGCGLPKDQHI